MHRTIMIATAGAFGLLALSMPAAAQYGGAPQSPPPEAPHANRQAAAPAAAAAVAATPAEVLAAAACAIGRDAHVGDALLASVPRSPEERTAARGFLRVAERCVRSTSGIATSAMTLRGAVAETLYETQFATAPAARAPVLEAKPLVRPAAAEGSCCRRAGDELCPGRLHGAQTARPRPRLARHRAEDRGRNRRDQRAQSGLLDLCRAGRSRRHRAAQHKEHVRRGALPLGSGPARRPRLALGRRAAGAARHAVTKTARAPLSAMGITV